MRTRLLPALLAALLLLSALFGAAVRRAAAQTPAAPDPYALLDAVNVYRQTHGMYAYRVTPALMTSAQAHSVYQSTTGAWTHTGSGGTNVSQRATAAGYGSGAAVQCDENLAYGQNLTLDAVVQKWLDPEHLAILLSSIYVDAGAGAAADSKGVVYYTLNVCYVVGSSTAPTPNTSEGGILISTPLPDGTIYHIVQPGENLVLIAQAYSISLLDLFNLNHLPKDSPIYPDQKLLIQVAYTPTPTSYYTPSPTAFTPEPTSTRRPTRTPTPVLTATAVPPTLPPTLAPTPAPGGMSSFPVDMLLISSIVVFFAAGLLLIAAGSLLRLRA